MKDKQKTKKVVSVIVNIILWLFVAFSVVVTIVAFSAGANAKNVPAIGGKCFLSVQSGSMDAEKPSGVPSDKPSGFSKGTLLVSRYIAEDDTAIDELEVGDIITFEWDINGDGQLSAGEYNTHRIVSIDRDASGHVVSLETQGDNEEYSHGLTEQVRRSAVIAQYTGKKMPGIGAVQTFLSSRLGFFLCILLPLFAFFVYQLVVFILAVRRVRNSGKKVITAEDEEMIKQKAIEEYLRRQQQESADKQDGETSGKNDGGQGPEQ